MNDFLSMASRRLKLGQFLPLREGIIAGLFFSVLMSFIANALAEPIITKVIPSDKVGVLDYHIENCDGLLGFGRLRYDPSGRIVLTDWCLDEETGAFLSAEPLLNLELTAKSRKGRKFEELASGTSFYQRNHVEITPDGNIPGCTPEPFENILASIQSPASTDIPNQRFGYLSGYTYPETSPFPAADKVNILFGIRSVSPAPFGTETFRTGGIQNAQGDMLGTAIFEGETGDILINEGGGYTYGDANGALKISFSGDGTFTMTGSFKAKSLRIKGHEPTEMVETEGALAYFRGHVVGSDGAGMLGYGIVEGRVTDASDQIHNYQAAAYLLACIAGE